MSTTRLTFFLDVESFEFSKGVFLYIADLHHKGRKQLGLYLWPQSRAQACLHWSLHHKKIQRNLWQ
jgi:hypothetical protein